MDENDVRTMLGRLAETEAPPARIDIRQAIGRGRRARRLRMVKAGGSTLAVGAVVGVVVALAVPGGARSGSALGSGASASASAAPTGFNPLVPFASFGWLPAGYTPTGVNTPDAFMKAQIESLSAGSASTPATTFNLSVTAAGACTVTGSGPVLRCPSSYSYGNGLPIRATSSAPDVNGRPAYWAKDTGSSTLIWLYAPGAWSILEVPTNHWQLTHAREQMLIRIAANVRYGNTTPLTFPFWTADVPAGWKVSLAAFLVPPSGGLLSQLLDVGPAAAPYALELSVMPVTPGYVCGSPLPGQHLTHVTLDGTKAVLLTNSRSSDLCASDVDGLMVSVSFYSIQPDSGRRVPGLSLPGGVLGLAKSLHLLDPHRSNWTTSPVR